MTPTLHAMTLKLESIRIRKLDSTVADLTELNAICEMLGISIMDLFSERLHITRNFII